MRTLRITAMLALLLCAQAADATVFRCSGRGGIYYSDKGCRPGDTLAPSSGKGSMSIVGGSGGHGGSSGSAPQYKTLNRYTQRAEAGANKADKALGNK